MIFQRITWSFRKLFQKRRWTTNVGQNDFITEKRGQSVVLNWTVIETRGKRCGFHCEPVTVVCSPRPNRDGRVSFLPLEPYFLSLRDRTIALFFLCPIRTRPFSRRHCRTSGIIDAVVARNGIRFSLIFCFFFFCFIIVIVILFRFVAAETGRQLVGYPAARSCSARDVCQQSAATVKIGGTCPPRTNTVGVTQLPGPVCQRISTAAGPGKRGRAVRRTWRARIVPDRRRQRDPIPNQCWTRIVYYFFFI